MASIIRTHHCGALRQDHVGQTVSLAGWVNTYRDFGGLIFIDLRDREGITQIVFHPENAAAHELADKLRKEDVIWVKGKCVAREEGMANPKLATGQVEIIDGLKAGDRIVVGNVGTLGRGMKVQIVGGETQRGR